MELAETPQRDLDRALQFFGPRVHDVGVDASLGRLVHYRAEPKALAPLIDWIGRYGAFWRDRFDRLEALLKRMER